MPPKAGFQHLSYFPFLDCNSHLVLISCFPLMADFPSSFLSFWYISSEAACKSVNGVTTPFPNDPSHITIFGAIVIAMNFAFPAQSKLEPLRQLYISCLGILNQLTRIRNSPCQLWDICQGAYIDSSPIEYDIGPLAGLSCITLGTISICCLVCSLLHRQWRLFCLIDVLNFTTVRSAYFCLPQQGNQYLDCK